MRNKLDILNEYHNLILDEYNIESLYCLRGEKEDNCILNGINIIEWHSNACLKIKDISFNSFENLDNLLICSDEIIFFTANLFLIKPFLSYPDKINTGNAEVFIFDQGVGDKRFNMFSNIVYEKLYTYWNHIAMLLKARFLPDTKTFKVNFSYIIDSLKNQTGSENLHWLRQFKENEYSLLNMNRKEIVHARSLDTKFKYEMIKKSKSHSEIEELFKDRDSLPEYFKQHISYTLTGFGKVLNFIME